MFQALPAVVSQAPVSGLFSPRPKAHDTLADDEWKKIVTSRPPEAYLNIPSHKLPNFNKYHWRIYLAPIITHRDTLNLHSFDSSYAEDADHNNAVRALYLVQKIDARSPGVLHRNDEWRFLSGDIKTSDINVQEAVYRIVEQKTGLHAKSILGSFHPNIIRDEPGQQRNVCLFLIVSVQEEDTVNSQDDIALIPLKLFKRHDGHRWVAQSDKLNDRIYPVDYIRLILDWPWLNPMHFLHMPAKDVPKVTGQGYFLNAAIMRQTGSAKPAILMLRRKSEADRPSDWALPGGKLLADDRTVETILRRMVEEQTGLTMMRVIDHCSARTMGPVQMKARFEEHGAAFDFVLGYRVTVKNSGLPQRPEGVEWRWVEDEELNTMNSSTRLYARRALRAEVVQSAALRKYDGRHRDVRSVSVCHWDREIEE